MLRLLLIIIFISVGNGHTAKIDKQLQLYISQNQQTYLKIWIFFTDKGPSSELNFSKASAHLTEKAFQRRLKINRPEQVDITDFPVYEKYMEQVSGFVSILNTSRWLNAVSCMVKQTDLKTISEFSFVKEIRLVSFSKREIPELKEISLAKKGSYIMNTNLDYGPSATQLSQIKVTDLHNIGFSGDGVNIALLDNGYNLYKTHINFDSLEIVDVYDFIHNDTSVDDTNSVWVDGRPQGFHGTTVLSVIGGYTSGLLIGPAYNATYMLYRTEIDSVEIPQEEDNWVAGLERAEAMGADLVNSSLGYIDWYSQLDMDGKTAVTTLATNIAEEKGLIVVNSAGNEGNNSNLSNTLIAPADGKYVITAGAVDASGSVAFFSSHGPTADGRIKPDIAAMGFAVVVASYLNNNGFGQSNGTSYSSPLIAGAVALLIEAFPEITPMQVRNALRETGSQYANPDNKLGWGILDIKAAYDKINSANQISLIQHEVNFPNPFTESTRIKITQEGFVDLVIYDILGREVAVFPKRFVETDAFVSIDKSHLKASGVYFYRMIYTNAQTNSVLKKQGKLIYVKN
jgi:hypothetical protein